MTDRLAEIAARAAALPCEDWRAVETHGIGVSLWNVEHGPADSPGDCYDRFEDPPREVAEFAAHARADVPWLLAEVGRLQDSLTALEKFAREEIHAKTTRLGEALQREYRLKLAILDHHDQKADDRCIEDDDRLYAAAGLSPCDRRVGIRLRCWPTAPGSLSGGVKAVGGRPTQSWRPRWNGCGGSTRG